MYFLIPQKEEKVPPLVFLINFENRGCRLRYRTETFSSKDPDNGVRNDENDDINQLL